MNQPLPQDRTEPNRTVRQLMLFVVFIVLVSLFYYGNAMATKRVRDSISSQNTQEQLEKADHVIEHWEELYDECMSSNDESDCFEHLCRLKVTIMCDITDFSDEQQARVDALLARIDAYLATAAEVSDSDLS